MNNHGNITQHSTIDNLLLTYNDISASVDSGALVDLIFFYFSKAFDTVSHVVLLEKLACIGVAPRVVDWIREFLMRRFMCVEISGKSSSSVPVMSGVPQGSVLGPVLFILYVNHLTSYLTCNFMLFADDIKLYLI